MDFTNSITWGGGGGDFNSVWGKIKFKMTETFNVNTNKHEMFRIKVILMWNKFINYLRKNVEVF